MNVLHGYRLCRFQAQGTVNTSSIRSARIELPDTRPRSKVWNNCRTNSCMCHGVFLGLMSDIFINARHHSFMWIMFPSASLITQGSFISSVPHLSAPFIGSGPIHVVDTDWWCRWKVHLKWWYGWNLFQYRDHMLIDAINGMALFICLFCWNMYICYCSVSSPVSLMLFNYDFAPEFSFSCVTLPPFFYDWVTAIKRKKKLHSMLKACTHFGIGRREFLFSLILDCFLQGGCFEP